MQAREAIAAGPAREELRHVLLLRTDHLGDMLLTLPMATAIKQAWPHCRVSVLASEANAPAARHHPHVDHVEVDPQEAKDSTLHGVLTLARRLRQLGCDAAVVVHPTPRLAVAVFLARIARRAGTAYRAYSLLFNRRVQQHRRRSDRHESELNLELLAALGITSPAAPHGLWRSDPEEVAVIDRLLAAHHLDPHRFIVLHPGSAGSAMNWSPERYIELGVRLRAGGQRCVITGGPREAALTRQVSGGIGGDAVDLGARLQLGELAELLRRARVFIGCSTGPTHLAAVVGTPVVALFPPLRATLPRRWRPLGEQVTVVQPAVDQVCPRCLHERCPFYHCVERYTAVDRVAAAVAHAATATRGAP